MKTPLFLLGLLLLAVLLALAEHGAQQHSAAAGGQQAPHALLRVLRPPAVAQQHRQVRAVK